MSKETFYFSHDYNSRSDIKIQKLIARKGYLGYGLFWALIENLYNNANALPLDYEILAFDLRTDEDIIKSIINDFDLFENNGEYFGSNSVQRRLDERDLKSKKARESALNRWKKPKKDANALQAQSECNAIKESKVKESKVNKNKEDINSNIETEVSQQTNNDFNALNSKKEKEETKAQKTIREKREFIEALETNGAFKDYAEEYVNYRIEKKISLSKIVLNKFLKESQGLDINEVIEVCMSKGWQGFERIWYDNLKSDNKTSYGKPKNQVYVNDVSKYTDDMLNDL